MNEKDKAAHLGLPWPQAYEALRSLIQEQWGIGEEIYLSRKLSGGKSGALVYAADITSRDYTGQAILKFDRAPDPGWQEKSEAERHRRAFEVAPDYAAKHLPKILHTLHHGESLAILSSIAGRGLEYAAPWAECSHKRQLSIVRLLSRDLLEDWNAGHELAPGMQMPQDLLRSWLSYRLDPKQSKLHGFLSAHCSLSADEPSFTFEGHWYPNPLAFATATSDMPERIRLRAILGNVHGDLHGYNILVGGAGAAKTSYHLIDLAFFQDKQFLFYDHAYFALSHLLAMREQVDAETWESILDHLSPFHHLQEETGLRGDDLGLIALVRALRRELLDWVDRHQANRLSYMESQYLLARVAAGLNFANKPLPDKSRRMAFLYAAANLKDYLKLNGLDWPKHGPLFDFEGRPQAAGDAADDSPAEAPDSQKSAHPPLPDKPGIAVLAFENLSGDPTQEYFADGITEEIITTLSHIDWLMVISRGSTFAYKGQAVAAKRVGQELGVHYVVEGSVRKAGKRVRVSAQLIDAKNGHHVWAERYDRDLDDIFVLQEEIAEAIVANIDWKLKATERELAQRKHSHVSVWDKFQQGLWYFFKFTEEDEATARQHLFKTIEQSPKFAAAYAVLAVLDCRRILLGKTEAPDELLKSAYEQAAKAVSLDEGSSLARLALGRVYSLQGKYDRAIEEAETSIALNPSSSPAYVSLAAALIWSGRAAEALPVLDMSIRLSPKGPYLKAKLISKAFCHYVLGDLTEAQQMARRSLYGPAMGPFSYMILAAILVQQDRLEEARAAIAESQKIRPDMTLSLLQVSWQRLVPHYMEMLVRDLRKAGLPE